MKNITRIFVSALLLFALTACGTNGSSLPSAPQLDGMYGGIMNMGGAPFLAYAFDIDTDSKNDITGAGAISDGVDEFLVGVTGWTATDGTVYLRLRDGAGDYIYLDTTRDGSAFRGTWTTNVGSQTGTTRFTREDNIDSLSIQGDAGTAVGIRDVF